MPFDGRARVAPVVPVGADLADVWLEHALACVVEAAGVPTPERQDGVASGVAQSDGDEHERFDASRRAVVFAALALEARLNRVLARCDAEERRALAHLAPAEKFRLAPRLLDEPQFAAEDAALCELVVEVFAARDELVDADAAAGAEQARFTPRRAPAIVRESARICWFLATLTDDVPVSTAQHVWQGAGALARRADGLPPDGALDLPRWEWASEDEFPPNLIGS